MLLRGGTAFCGCSGACAPGAGSAEAESSAGAIVRGAACRSR